MDSKRKSVVSPHYKKWITNVHFIVIVGLIFRIFYSIYFVAFSHPDEIEQGLFMTYRLIFPLMEDDYVPWEFETQTRSYLYPVLLIPFVKFTFILGFDGLSVMRFLRFLFSIPSLLAIYPLGSTFGKSEQEFSNSNLIIRWIVATFLPVIYFTSNLTSQALALSIFLYLIPFSRKLQFKRYASWITISFGILLGFSCSLRYNHGIVWLPYLIWQVKQNRIEGIKMGLGVLIGFIPHMILDYVYYGSPLIPIKNFFVFNVVDQSNVRFGTDPVYAYVLVLIALLSSGSLIFFKSLKMNFAEIRKQGYIPLFTGGLIYFLILSYLSHKEIRFVIIIYILMTMVISLFISQILSKGHLSSRKRFWKAMAVIFFILSTLQFTYSPMQKELNVLEAEDYIHNIQPNASIFYHPEVKHTRGMIVCGENMINCGQYYHSKNISIITSDVFKTIDYFFLAPTIERYEFHREFLISQCNASILHTVGKNRDNNIFNQYLQSFYKLYVIEIWTCTASN